ncbi:MAG: type II secretion system F family protein, partial [Puniceicoccales bacterium]|nr:type II secretion system F family protein [Puniceicoccales bacterium]
MVSLDSFSDSSASSTAGSGPSPTGSPLTGGIALKKAQKAKIKLADVAVFAQQLSSMLKAGLSLSHALEASSDEMENRTLKFIVTKIREGIFSGLSFSDAIKQFPSAFPPIFLSMVEAGEVSGGLAEA